MTRGAIQCYTERDLAKERRGGSSDPWADTKPPIARGPIGAAPKFGGAMIYLQLMALQAARDASQKQPPHPMGMFEVVLFAVALGLVAAYCLGAFDGRDRPKF